MEMQDAVNIARGYTEEFEKRLKEYAQAHDISVEEARLESIQFCLQELKVRKSEYPPIIRKIVDALIEWVETEGIEKLIGTQQQGTVTK